MVLWASENASRTPGGCFALSKMRPVHQKALSGTEFFKLPEKGEHCLHRRQQTPERKRPFPVQCSEDAPRTVGGRFRYRVPPNEDAPRTVGGRFRYRISLPYRRSLFFTPNASGNAPRTTEACFLHRAHIPYQRRPSPVPNFSNCQKKESIAGTEYNKRQKGRGPFLYGALKMYPVP